MNTEATAAAQELAEALTARGITARTVEEFGTLSVAIEHTVYEEEFAVLYIEQPTDDPRAVLWLVRNEAGEALDWGDWTVPADRRHERTLDRIQGFFAARSCVPGRPTTDGHPQHYNRHHLLVTIEAVLARLGVELALGDREQQLAELTLDTLLYTLDHPGADLREVIREQHGMIHPEELIGRWTSRNK